MRKINKIIIHHSESEFGDKQLINQLHIGQDNSLILQAWPKGTEIYKKNPFSSIGYHYLILNGFINPTEYRSELDGDIETGRSEDEEGAHCLGQNLESIGVCLVGKTLFSGKQFYYALPRLLTKLCRKYSLTLQDIYGHYEFNKEKGCPGIDIKLIQNILQYWL